jgi:hypothetical protein
LSIPLPSEQQVVDLFSQGEPPTLDDVTLIRARLDRQSAMDLAILGLRMAVLGVRKGSRSFVPPSTACLLIDDELMDWRDVLGALSIANHCASRLNIDFDQLIQSMIGLAANGRRSLVLNDYVARTPTMRDIGTMGFVATGSGEDFTILRRL